MAIDIDRIHDGVLALFSRGDMMARAFGNRSTGMRWIGFTRRGDLGPCRARQISGFDKRRAGEGRATVSRFVFSKSVRSGPEEREPDLQIVIDMNAARNGNEVAKRLISRETIRALASAESFARGRSYFDDGTVTDVLRRGDRLTAEASMEVEALLRLCAKFLALSPIESLCPRIRPHVHTARCGRTSRAPQCQASCADACSEVNRTHIYAISSQPQFGLAYRNNDRGHRGARCNGPFQSTQHQ